MTSISDNVAKAIANKIAESLDRIDGQDGRINSETWKRHSDSRWDIKHKDSGFISVFNASKSIEKYIKRESENKSNLIDIIGKKWYNSVLTISTEPSENIKQNQKLSANKNLKIITPSLKYQTEENDATIINKSNILIASRYENKKSPKILRDDFFKEEIASNMHKKWSKIFEQSPLSIDFYYKLYDVIKILNCKISDCDFRSKNYKSKKEQTMDEVIAIFAGEAQLNPKAKNGTYKGLFQLATTGLIDLKEWANKHKDFPEIKTIKNNIDINGFWNLSGSEQLNYLIAYIENAKEYSKISKNESITPAQLWAMIKFPFEGNINSKITAQKKDAINNVFYKSNIKRG